MGRLGQATGTGTCARPAKAVRPISDGAVVSSAVPPDKRGEGRKTRHTHHHATAHAARLQQLVQLQPPARLVGHGGVVRGQVLGL